MTPEVHHPAWSDSHLVSKLIPDSLSCEVPPVVTPCSPRSHYSKVQYDSTLALTLTLTSPASPASSIGYRRPPSPRDHAEAANDGRLISPSTSSRQRGSWKEVDREPGAVRMRTPTILVSARECKGGDRTCCRGSASLRPVGVSLPSSNLSPIPLSSKPFPLRTSASKVHQLACTRCSAIHHAA